MPLYDYRCTACGQEVEVMHGINDTGPSTCQHCGGAMRKALSPPAIHFKGSGWAKKDAAASAKKPAPKAGSTSDKDAKATGSASSTSDGAKSDPGSTPSSGSEAKGKAASTAGSKTD